ncbi:MAG TPA: hypothetical protein VGM54_07000 [Chthoniobacter sp.]|jgi:hypothetical protein
MPLKWKLLISLLVVAVTAATATLVYRLYRLGGVPPAAWHCLREPKQMVLYSIHPEEPADFVKGASVFHGYRILGEVPVTAVPEQGRVVDAVRHAVLTALDPAVCFNPRHGIRVTDGQHSCDFVICFECGRMDYYLDNTDLGSVPIGGSAESLNAVLRKAQVPLAD